MSIDIRTSMLYTTVD